MSIIDGKFIILFCALIAFATCKPNQFIKKISETAVRSVGEDVALTCTVENPSGYTVSWVKQNKENTGQPFALSYNTLLTVKDSRFNLTATPDSYTFHIRNIEYDDAAQYSCTVLIENGKQETEIVELLVRHPPKISQVIEITPQVASLNGSAELKCTADGYPKPSISWIRENNELLPMGGHFYNGSILKITEVAKQDRGLYYCIADNHIEPADKRPVNFEVEFPPQIFASRPKVAQAPGFDTELECRVEGFPPPSVVWLKNNEELQDNSDQSKSTTAKQNAITTSVLHITTVELSQYGDYECKAENKLGSAKTTINLFQQKIPNINFSGLQWNASTSQSIHKRSTIDIIAIILLLIFLF